MFSWEQSVFVRAVPVFVRADRLFFTILEPVEIRRHRGAGHVLTGDTDKRAGEVWLTRPTRLIGQDARVEQLGESSFLVRLVLQNSGWLPTNVTEKAVERKAVRELEVELDLPEGARLVGGEMKTDAGQLKGRVEKRSTTWWGNDESTTDLAKLEWVVEAPSGTEIELEARHQRAGTLRRRITLS